MNSKRQSGSFVAVIAGADNASVWSDEQLLAKLVKSHPLAWREFERRYERLIERCILKVTRRFSSVVSVDDVREIGGQLRLSLLANDMHKLRIYNPSRGTKLGSWIGMLSVNAAYDFLRSAGRRPLLDKVDGAIDPHEEVDRTPLDQLIEKERWEHLNGLLAEFTDKDRTFVELYYQRGMEADEIAAEMQISLKTVYSKKHKIRAHLVRSLQGLTGESPISDLALA